MRRGVLPILLSFRSAFFSAVVLFSYVLPLCYRHLSILRCVLSRPTPSGPPTPSGTGSLRVGA